MHYKLGPILRKSSRVFLQEVSGFTVQPSSNRGKNKLRKMNSLQTQQRLRRGCMNAKDAVVRELSRSLSRPNQEMRQLLSGRNALSVRKSGELKTSPPYTQIMVNLRTFTISDETFGGFSTHVDLDTVDSIDQICNVVMECLNEALSSINLSVLSGNAQRLNVHIHDVTIGEMLLSNPDKVFYVCGHCKNQE